MDELLERLQPQFIELFFQPVFHRLDVVVGDLFDVLDPLGIFRRELPVKIPQRLDLSWLEALERRQRQAAERDEIFHLHPHPVLVQRAF